MRKMPGFLKQYFWDVDFEKLDYRKYPAHVITSIMEYGDETAIRWLMKTFNIEELKSILCATRVISPRSANFWAVILGVSKNKIKCLKKRYLEMRKQLWPY